MEDISNLIEILKEEEIIYKDILELANKKTEMISEENLDQIEVISGKEEELIKRAKLIEYKREDQITLIEKALNISEISDISSLSQRIEDEDLKIQLTDTQEQFATTLDELKRVNLMNNMLIKDALEYISLSLNIATQATAEGTYGKDAAEAEVQTNHRNMFDFKG